MKSNATTKSDVTLTKRESEDDEEEDDDVEEERWTTTAVDMMRQRSDVRIESSSSADLFSPTRGQGELDTSLRFRSDIDS